MGFQITVFLTLIVYIEGISKDIPVPREMSAAPNLLHFFIVAILVNGFSMLITTMSLVMHHASSGLDMSKWQAKFAIYVSYFFNKFPGVDLPPSKLPPFLFQLLNRTPPDDMEPKKKCFGFGCWYIREKPILGQKINQTEEARLLVTNIPKKEEKDPKQLAIDYYAQIVNYFCFACKSSACIMIMTHMSHMI